MSVACDGHEVCIRQGAREFFSEADGDWLILLTMDDYCLCRDGANAVGDVISSHEYSHRSGEPCRRLVQHPLFPYLFYIVVPDGHLQQSDRGGFDVTSRECVSRCWIRSRDCPLNACDIVST